jgi:hypothetical protein
VEERQQILTAQRNGDRLAVQLLLSGGELGLLRPKSFRPLLLGEQPSPTSPRDPGGV